MMPLNTIKKLITHNGAFHADDIFATATLVLMLEKEGIGYEIIRTRDEEIIKSADYVYDVGGIYDADENRFDHHQVGGAGKHENGIEYASFGLVWKKYGEKVAGSKEVADLIEKKLVNPVDAGDNGMDLVENKGETSPYLIQHLFGTLRPTWKESDENLDANFRQCVEIAKTVLSREITQTKDILEAKNAVLEIYNNTLDKKVIILDQNYPSEYILKDFKEVLYVVYPRATGDWGVKTLREDSKTFKNRKDFPKEWGGARDEALVALTGVADAIFCHRALFLAVAKSKEGAMKLAQIAVEY